ncbi:MAG: DNA polymerase III subunit gamma/tau [Dehalobacterium sp.]
MAYVALYRQWRPQKFDDVVGQDHISRTLKNAIKTNRIVHAYLFTGPRGTGKTSSAKIMAKAVNCLSPEEGEACNHCTLCTRINSGDFMDIIEIDAASNRGIDEIRDLREKVKYAPVEGRYKIYIIDEVHMLTTEAFNALLKTLEEPPKHVIFILATTEPHKVPVTVLSRCQRFDFKRIGTRFVVERLKEICTSEGLRATEPALQILAKKAEGSMRDALSLLDQCLSFSDDEITEETIASVLGTVDGEFIKNIVQSLAEKNYGIMISMIDNLIQEGKDIRQFSHDLVEYFRNLVLVKVSHHNQNQHNTNKLDLPDYLHQVLIEQGNLFSTEDLFQILEVLSEGEAQLKFSSQPRITLELSLIKAAGIPGMIKEKVSEHQVIVHQQQDQKIDTLVNASVAEKTETRPEAGPQNIKVKDAVLEIDFIKSHWKKVLELVRRQNPSTYAYLVEGEPIEIKENKIILLYKPQLKLHLERLGEPVNKLLVEKVLLTVFQHKLTVQGTMAYAPKDGDKITSEVKEMFGDVNLEIIE